MKDKIREICTFHDKDGTSGYLLDEQRFAKIFEILDNQKKAIIQECIDLSDKIESNTTFDEWRAFKKFRNTLKDKINNLK